MNSPTAIQPLPWHRQQFERVIADRHFHHGSLVSGLSGIGKREFSVALARRLLCLSDDPLDCGGCQSCQLFNAGTHPDLHVVCSEKETLHGRIPLLGEYSNRYQDIAARERKTNPSQLIPVDQVRLLIQRFVQSPHISASRVAIIVPADRMNVNAANALLKLLEEPPENSFLLLLTAQPGNLPATVRSRCVDLHLESPGDEEAMQWLANNAPETVTPQQLQQLAINRPLDTLTGLQSGDIEQAQNNLTALVQMLQGRNQPVSLAAILAKQDIAPLLEWLQTIASDLIRAQNTGTAVPWEPVGESGNGLDLTGVSTPGLFELYARLGRYKQMARDQLNAQLALEDILIGMQRLFNQPG